MAATQSSYLHGLTRGIRIPERLHLACAYQAVTPARHNMEIKRRNALRSWIAVIYCLFAIDGDWQYAKLYRADHPYPDVWLKVAYTHASPVLRSCAKTITI